MRALVKEEAREGIWLRDAPEPEPGGLPLALDCAMRDAKRLGCLSDAQTAEIAELHHAGLPLVECG